MKITANISVELRPFTTPNFVARLGAPEETSISIKDLDPLTLEALCDQFRNDVFKKAGKEQPTRVDKA